MGTGILKYKCPKCVYGKVATRIIDDLVYVWCRKCNTVYRVKDDETITKANMIRDETREWIKKHRG